MTAYSTEIRRFGPNLLGGRDIIVGDIHGCFSKLHSALLAIDFDGAHDRLFSVGDLVDRGPESDQALVWLRQPWFFACRGNHEEAACEWAAGNIPIDLYRNGFGGGWNIGNQQAESERIAAAFLALPLGFELETATGLVGILHADCPADDWEELKDRLAAGGFAASATADLCVWSRDRTERGNEDQVAGVRAVVVGHTPMDRMTSLGNVIYIDTMGWKNGHFTLLDAATLRPAEPKPAVQLSWT